MRPDLNERAPPLGIPSVETEGSPNWFTFILPCSCLVQGGVPTSPPKRTSSIGAR